VTGEKADAIAAGIEKSAQQVYRFGKAVLRITPQSVAPDSLPQALRDTVPHLNAAAAQAIVCVETTCHPPVKDPNELKSVLTEMAAGFSASAQSDR